MAILIVVNHLIVPERKHPVTKFEFETVIKLSYISDMFLVISGYLNSKNVYDRLDKEGFWQVTIKFLIRRYFRILPLYYLLMLDPFHK